MIRANSPDDLHKQLRELLGATAVTYTVGAGGAASGNAGPGGAATTTKPKPDPKPKDEAPKVEEVVADATVVEEKPAEELTFPTGTGLMTETEYADPSGFYLTVVKPSVLKVSAKHGRPGVEKLLADFNAPNAKEVPQERYPELLAAIDKMLEG